MMIYLIALFLLINTVSHENLVPNGSFELFNTCPELADDDKITVLDWYRPTIGTSDYFNMCSMPLILDSLPVNNWGTQVPHSGRCYMGLYLCYSKVHGKGYFHQEYIGVKLKTRLEKDKKYKFKAYISVSDSSICGISKFEVGFSETQYQIEKSAFIDCCLDVKSKYELLNGRYIDNAQGWQEITVTFSAQGNEEYLYIGRFSETPLCEICCNKKQLIKSNRLDPYCYIDDVSIVQQ